MICPILTAAMMTTIGRTCEVKAEVECYREDCGMWPSCRRSGTDEWTKDAVLTSIPESEAKGGED